MPLDLTTPYVYNLGHGQGSASYSQAKIVGFTADIEPDPATTMRIQYGDTTAGVWVPGVAPVEYLVIVDVPAEVGYVDGEFVEVVAAVPKYTDWVTSTKAASTETLLSDEVAAALYTYLCEQEGFEGEIV